MKTVIKLIFIVSSLSLLFLFILSSRLMAQTDPEECRKPTSYTDPDGDATNPSNAYDGDCGDESTYADELIDQNPGDEIIFHTWQTTSYTYTSLTLYVKYTTSGFSDDLWCIYYSTDGGSSWNELVACNSNNYASIQTASVSLSASQDLSQLQVKVYGDKVKGPDNGHVHIYDVYTIGTYEADTTPPTFSNDGDNSTGSVVEGEIVKVYALWEDNIGLSKGVLRTNKTGTWQNETWYDFTSNPEWFNVTIDTTGYGEKIICWNQWANDTSNNWNTSMEMHCFQVSVITRWLEVEWDVSSDINSTQCTESSPCNINQYSTFNASVKVICHTNPSGYSCGEVYGSIRYNTTGIGGPLQTTTYDFKGITSPSYTHNATKGSFTSIDIPLWSGAELTTEDYGEINESDDIRDSFTPLVGGVYAYFQFHFKINENPSDITELGIYWEGYSDGAGINLYIRNFTISPGSWSLIGSLPDPRNSDGYITNTIEYGINNYIDEDNYIHLLAVVSGAIQTDESIYTDYVYVNVTTGEGETKELISEDPEQTEQPFNLPSLIVFYDGFDDQTTFEQNWNNITNNGDDGYGNNVLFTLNWEPKKYYVLRQRVNGDSDLLYAPEALASVYTKRGFNLNKTYMIDIWLIGSGRSSATGNEYDQARILICPTPIEVDTQNNGGCTGGVNLIQWGYDSYNGVCYRDGCFLTGQFHILINQTTKTASVFFSDGTPLSSAQDIDISSITENYTILINTFIRTATTGGQNSFIFQEVNHTSINYFQPNPLYLGVLNDGESYIINYTLKAIGDINSRWKIDMNFSSNESISNQTNAAIINISKPLTGTLEVSLDSPDPSTYTQSNPYEVYSGDTFWINSTLTCSGGLCFNVNATPRYNSTSNEPDTSIGKDKGDTPFSILLPYGNVEYLNSTNLAYGDESVHDITVDNEGNITLVGYDNTTGNLAWRIEKRRSDGTLLWSKVLDFSSGTDMASGVITDSQNNVIVCGHDNVNGNEQWRVIKFDKDGNWLWNYTWNPSNNDDEATVCGVDSNDNILVGGWDNSPGDDQWVVKKLDSDGNEIDSWIYNPTAGSDRLFSLVVDKYDNSVYVGGDHFVSGNDWNFAIRKLNSTLDLQWEYVKDFTPSWDESCFGLTLDSQRNVIGAGGINGCPSHDCNWEFKIVKLTPSGDELWNKTFKYSNWWNRAHCVAVNSRDEIFVAGIDEYIGYLQNQWRIIQLDSDGNRLTDFTLNANSTDWLLGCAIDKNDDLWLGGYLDGNEPQWTIEKLSRFDMQPCGYLKDGDICKVNWLINVTGTGGVWAVDVFYNSSNSYVQFNDTDDAIVRIIVTVVGCTDCSFSILLPGQSWIISNETYPGNATAKIEFNFTSATQSNVEPCIVGTNCVDKQTSTIPIFTLRNDGDGSLKWIINITADLPSGLTLKCDKDSDPTGATVITTSPWVVNSSIPVNGQEEVWCWADVTNQVPPGTYIRNITHISSPGT